ncbi:MAG: fumarylacetoacetate hydrolase family protein [Flavobacteriales bacterium]|nr:fumarylacetoacetate hydrolase family protein [Flavobacteriales bacterium]
MKIICIGRNYSEHAKELKNEVPSEPIFFCKPDSAILPKGNPFFIPDWSSDINYEVELIYRIEKLGKNIDKKFASRYYTSVGLGIDFTARDVQSQLKAKGLPWEKAKGFDGSAVISDEFISLDTFEKNPEITFSLRKNGDIVQHGNSSEMIFSIDDIIAFVSKFMTLKIGDLIYTGTPSGVGPVVAGDELEGYIGDKFMFKTKIR